MKMTSPMAAILIGSLVASARAQCEFDKAVPDDAAKYRRFGQSVAREGTYAVIGAPEPNNGALGAVYVFEEDVDIGLRQLDKLSDAMGSADDRFGAAVALSGNRLVVGAFQNDASATNGGKVFVYELDDLNNPDEIPSPSSNSAAFFGRALSLDGDLLAVGAPGEGKVYVYSAPSWTLDHTFTGSADFGAAVAVSEASMTLVVGEPTSSSATVFDLTGMALPAVLTPAAASDELGFSVAIHSDLVDGDRLVLGAPKSDAQAVDAGAAYVYSRDAGGSVWSLKPTLFPTRQAAGDQFGYAVDVQQDLILVGTPVARNFVYGCRTGGADVFAYDSASERWKHVYRLTSDDSGTDDRYGEAVSLDGGLFSPKISAFVGAPQHLIDKMDEGAAYDHRLDGDCDDNLVSDIEEITANVLLNADTNCLLDACQIAPSFISAVLVRGEVADPLIKGLSSKARGDPDREDVDTEKDPNQAAPPVTQVDIDPQPGSGADPSQDPESASTTVVPEATQPRFVDLTEVVVPGGETSGFAAASEYFDNFFSAPQALSYDEVPGERGVPNRGALVETLHVYDEVTVQNVIAAEMMIQISASENPRTDPSNDVLALEVVDPVAGTFAWKTFIKDLPEAGGDWQHGQEAVFTLDLENLPLAGGSSVDLLPELVDGMLDTVVYSNSGVGYVALDLDFFDPVREYTVRYTPGTALGTVLDAFPKGSKVLYTNTMTSMVHASFRNSNVGVLRGERWFESISIVPPSISFGGSVEPSPCIGTTLVEARQRLGFDDMGLMDLRNEMEEVAMLDTQFPTHFDLGPCADRRVIRIDDNCRINSHATAVAGTLASEGVANPGASKGMLPMATVYAYTRLNLFNQAKSDAGHDKDLWDLPAKHPVQQMLDAWSRGAYVVNNSWGYKGDLSSYTAEAPDIDEMVAKVDVTACFAAGNCQQAPPNSCPPGGGYSRILSTSTAKNVITVGGLCGDADTLPVSASWGPTLDGRLKPDIVSLSVRARGDLHDSKSGAWEKDDDPGQHLCLTDFQQSIGSATSWGTPLATAGASILAWQVENDTGGAPDPALVKALMCNTATDIDHGGGGVNTGPDYKTGYGLFNVKRAHTALVNGDYVVEPTGIMGTMASDVHTYEVRFDSNGRLTCVTRVGMPCPPGGAAHSGDTFDDSETNWRDQQRPTRIVPPALLSGGQAPLIKFMLVWSDPRCDTGCDSSDPGSGALVNDLDLTLTDMTDTYHPYTLNPNAPDDAAMCQVNRRDNVEQVVVAEGVAAAGHMDSWLLQVSAHELQRGPQPYVLTWFDEGASP